MRSAAQFLRGVRSAPSPMVSGGFATAREMRAFAAGRRLGRMGLDYLAAVVIGLLLAVCALAYFGVLRP